MKSFLPLLSIAAILFVSCSTAYQSGQTPDDVYYSPERPVDEYVRVEKKNSKQYRYDEYYDERDERIARMKLRNRLYNTLDDDWYAYEMYSRYRGTYSNYYTPMNYCYFWNYNFNPYFNSYTPYYRNYYSPYAPGYVTITPREVYNKPRTYNLLVFDRDMNNVNPNLPKGNKAANAGYRDNTENYRGSGSNAGDFLRNVFSGSNNNSGNIKVGSSSNNNSSSGSSSGNSSSSGSGSSNTSRGNATRGNN